MFWNTPLRKAAQGRPGGGRARGVGQWQWMGGAAQVLGRSLWGVATLEAELMSPGLLRARLGVSGRGVEGAWLGSPAELARVGWPRRRGQGGGTGLGAGLPGPGSHGGGAEVVAQG